MTIMYLQEVLALHVHISCSNYMKIDEKLNFCVQVACSDHQRFRRYELVNAVISGSAEGSSERQVG